MANTNNQNITAPVYPGSPLRVGSTGSSVAAMQQKLNSLGTVFTGINRLAVDGRYGASTRNAVVRFQKQFSLNPDGVIGRLTWNSILAVENTVGTTSPTDVTTRYTGVLSSGSSGDQVRFLQSYLNGVRAANNHSWPVLTVDGRFGRNTALAVAGFQSANGLTVDGRVGQNTWAALVPAFNRSTKG